MAIIKIFHLLILTAVLLLCSCSQDEEVPYSWEPAFMNDGLKVSTASEQVMDPAVINEIYEKAELLDNIYSLLIQKNGFLIAGKSLQISATWNMNTFDGQVLAEVTRYGLHGGTAVNWL